MPDGPAPEPAVTRARRSQEEAAAPVGTPAETTDSSRSLSLSKLTYGKMYCCITLRHTHPAGRNLKNSQIIPADMDGTEWTI